MGTMNPQVTFETDFFQLLPGEDQKTNPGCYGQATTARSGVEVHKNIPCRPSPVDHPPNHPL
jgi:hypothetical protein